MTDPKSLEARVSTWLREQGYPLEMRTARDLRLKGIWTQLGRYYTDIETGHQRETDVYARSNDFGKDSGDDSTDVCLVIECKSAREKPWVLFTDAQPRKVPRTIHRSERLAVPNRDWLYRLHRAGVACGPLPLLDGYEPFGYALVRAFNNGNDDVAYSAMMSVAKAAAGVWADLAADVELVGVTDRAIVLPVLLIDAPLLRCDLDDNGQERLTRIDRGTVEWRYQLAPDHPLKTIITVVTTAALSELGDDLITTAANLQGIDQRGIAGS
ncbi:hypothetical protein [Nocardia sp. CA-119907]|uniref:hypothetical protein n=1 Tax=Nocardia sp. CA-119907 TaxID=3239973 RepID=UPI003D979DA0